MTTATLAIRTGTRFNLHGVPCQVTSTSPATGVVRFRRLDTGAAAVTTLHLLRGSAAAGAVTFGTAAVTA